MSRGGFLWLCLALTVALRGASVDVLLVAPDDASLRPVLQHMSDLQIETRAAWTFWRGQCGTKTLALTRSEGDPLNAVAATTLGIRLHAPRLIVVFGPARAHDPALQPGDLVVSERFAAFDGIISPITALGAGSDALRWMKRPHPMMTAGERETPTEFFPADAAAVAIARTLQPARGRLVVGVLGSAHQINREADRVAWLREQWRTSTEDGESAHVAGVGVLLGVPVFGVRVIDHAGTEAAEWVLRFLEAWK